MQLNLISDKFKGGNQKNFEKETKKRKKSEDIEEISSEEENKSCTVVEKSEYLHYNPRDEYSILKGKGIIYCAFPKTSFQTFKFTDVDHSKRNVKVKIITTNPNFVKGNLILQDEEKHIKEFIINFPPGTKRGFFNLLGFTENDFCFLEFPMDEEESGFVITIE